MKTMKTTPSMSVGSNSTTKKALRRLKATRQGSWRLLKATVCRPNASSAAPQKKAKKHDEAHSVTKLQKSAKNWGTTLSDMDADNWLVLAFFKIELWNFQDEIELWFCEASQNLSSFRQLFFHIFQGGTKGKMLKNQLAIFLHFSFGPNLETMTKKVV